MLDSIVILTKMLELPHIPTNLTHYLHFHLSPNRLDRPLGSMSEYKDHLENSHNGLVPYSAFQGGESKENTLYYQAEELIYDVCP